MSKSNTGHLRLADRITVNTVVLQNVALWETGSSGHFYMYLSKTALQIKTALLNRAHRGKLPEMVGRRGRILDLCRKSWPDLQSFEKLRLGFIYYKIYHLKVYSFVVFGIFTGFCNHHHFLVSRTFQHPIKSPSPLAVTPSFFSHSTWQPLIYFCPCGFACSGHFL